MKAVRNIKNHKDLDKFADDFKEMALKKYAFPYNLELTFNKVEKEKDDINIRQNLIKQIHAGCHYLWQSDLTPFTTEKELMYHLKNKAGMVQDGSSFPLEEETILILKELIGRNVFITKDANFFEDLTTGKAPLIVSCANASINQLMKLKQVLINDMVNLYRASNDPRCQKFLENENYKNQSF